MSNLTPEALRLLQIHAAGGWELVAKRQREALDAARLEPEPEPPLTLRTAAAKALCLLDTAAIAGGDIERVQKLLRDALGEGR